MPEKHNIHEPASKIPISQMRITTAIYIVGSIDRNNRTAILDTDIAPNIIRVGVSQTVEVTHGVCKALFTNTD